MTEKYAYELSLKLWLWLFKNPGKYKTESPYRDEIYNMKYYCPLCEYYRDGCNDCTLFKWRTCGVGAYDRWSAKNYKDKSAAAFIASKIRRYMRKKGWLKDEG